MVGGPTALTQFSIYFASIFNPSIRRGVFPL
jgi:hypothetical protein